jgi:hypothetical protein
MIEEISNMMHEIQVAIFADQLKALDLVVLNAFKVDWIRVKSVVVAFARGKNRYRIRPALLRSAST